MRQGAAVHELAGGERTAEKKYVAEGVEDSSDSRCCESKAARVEAIAALWKQFLWKLGGKKVSKGEVAPLAAAPAAP